MNTINTTIPPFITNGIASFSFFTDFRLEPEVATVFKIDEDIIFVFDEKIIPGSGDIVISSDTDTRHIDIDDASQVTFDILRILSTGFSAGGRRSEVLEFGLLVINPETDLLPDTTYTIQVEDEALADTAGNTLAGFNDIAVSAIDSAPNLRGYNRLDGSTDFKVDENIALFFDEAVVAGSGEIVISSDADTRTIDINDTSQVTFENNGLVIINPQEDLIANTVYTLQVPDGAVIDIEDNIFTNFNPTPFTTVAGSPPQLRFNIPDNDSSEFQVSDNIELFFDEDVIAGIGNIIISSGLDMRAIAINDISQVTFDEDRVIINPTDDLMPDVSYTVQIASGVITDLSGNVYSGFDNGTISTIEAPSFSLFGTIEDGESSIFKADENIVTSFSDNIVAGNGDIIISNGSDTRTIAIDDTSQVIFDTEDGFDGAFVTIDPDEDLISDTTYTVQIPSSAIIDTEGGVFAGINEAFLTTIDPGPIVRPIASTIFKADDLMLTFDEGIIAGEGDIVISNGVDERTIAIDDTSQVTFLGRSIVIDPSDDLAPGQYTGTIPSGAITDRAGNAFAGIDNDFFTIIDSAPILIDSNPFNGSTLLGIDENITLFFDEFVAAGSGDIIISNGTDTRIIAIDDANQVTFEEFTESDGFFPAVRFGIVTINPTEDLVPGTTYSVAIASGVITDTDENPYAGFSDVSFTTVDPMPIIAAGANEPEFTFG